MIDPSPFFDPEAPSADLDEFLKEIDVALDGFVLAEQEHLLLRRAGPADEARA
jgi:hypothetical protein